MLNLDDYKEIIIYSEDPTEKLGVDELILLLAELIDDEQISEVAGKYVDDYDHSWELIRDEIGQMQLENSALKEAYKQTYRRYQMCLQCIEDIIEIAKEQDNFTIGKRIEQLLGELDKVRLG